jgi:SagB-type dehydrogenase family enzyme
MRRHPVPGTSVEDAIRRRRSAMVFRHEPAPHDALRLAGELARGHSGLRRAPGIELQLAVHRVKGLESGLYRIHADTGELSPHRLGELAGPLVQACGGQEKAGQAAVGFLMVARLQEAAGRAGDRSYRDLLLEAGGIGQRIYLAAEATGLAARNLAAFRDDDLNRLVDLDGVRQAVVHLTMFGPGD